VKTEGTTAPLRFRGAPLLVEGLTPFRYQEILAGASVDVRLSTDAYKSGEATNIQTVPAGDSATWVRFSLDLSTPAGSYPGEVKLADSAYPIVVDVEAKPTLYLSPKSVTLPSRAGSTVTVEMTAANGGNAPVEIPGTGMFGLFAGRGLERSIAEAVRMPAGEGRERLDKFMNTMSDEHGGFVRAKVTEGAGPLVPGEFRNLKAKLRLPDELKPGKAYAGSWVIGTVRFRVRVEVPGQAAKESSREAE
jgi:hypothetical protein